MKGRASVFVKKMVSVLMAVVKAKSMAVKSKTSSMKTRLMIFGLLRNKKVLMTAISHKIHALVGQDKDDEQHNEEDNSKAIVLCNAAPCRAPPPPDTSYSEAYEDDDDDRYPDLRHSLFDTDDEDDGLGDCTGSVIDLVRNGREDQEGEFSLEDEIDHVADVFIRRFHKQMRMQKQESFKRYKEMLERSV